MATIPQFDDPSTMNKPGPWVVQPINSSSDGSASKWPPPPHRAISHDDYRVKLGRLWAEEKGIAVPGINYCLDRLPTGYQLMEYPKVKATTENDRHRQLFGHPSGRYYTVHKQFFLHFLWLMGGTAGKCKCTLCVTKKKENTAPISKITKPVSNRNIDPVPNKTTEPVSDAVSNAASKPRGRPPKSKDIMMRDVTADLGKRAKPVPNYFDKKLYEQRDSRIARPPGPNLPTDEEGTPDIYKYLVQLLYRHRDSKKLIDEDIEEKASPDWRAEHSERYGDNPKILTSHLTYVLLQHAFVPRIGELVLWCPDHPDDVDIVYNPEVSGFQFYSPERERFHGFPRWRAGVVTQCPSTDEKIDFPDVLCLVDRKDSLNRAGFRVETFPDPNDVVDKSASKQYRYVPLRQIRPLNQWQNVLRGIPENRLDRSIQHALTCMVSISLLEKYRFTGKWPEASIFCKGIYIGAELLIEGDAVKILPDQQASSPDRQECTDILVISSIRLHLHDIDLEHLKDTSGGICGRSSITLVGTAYTLDPSRGYIQPSGASAMSNAVPQPVPKDTIKYALPTVGAAAYGNWYALHGPHQKYEITHDRVLGRLYESGAMGMWSGTLGSEKTAKVPPSLSYDLSSVISGRRYGTMTDSRIGKAQSGAVRWYWADTRVQALSLETVNGVEVGVYDTTRDMRTMQAWRATLKIVDGTHTPADEKDSMLVRQKGRPKGSRVIGNVLVKPWEQSPNEEVDTPPRGSLNEAVRSPKVVGAMIGAGAALEEEGEEDEDEEGEDEEGEVEDDEDNEAGIKPENSDTAEDEPPPNSSKVSIMEQRPCRGPSRFIVLDDSDDEMRPMSPHKRSTSNISPEHHGPYKARKSAGGSKISLTHAGRYDSSITPTMTEESGYATWKGRGQADRATAGWDAETPVKSVEAFKPVIKDREHKGPDSDQGDEEEEEGDEDDEDKFTMPQQFAEPEPRDDDDYTGEDETDDDDDDDDDEEERVRTLANFQRTTFDRAGKRIRF